MDDKKIKRRKKGSDTEENRRWFMRKLAALGGGAVAGSVALDKTADGQDRVRSGRLARVRKKLTIRGKAAQVAQFRTAFQKIKASGKAGARANKAWKKPLEELSWHNKLAAVAVLEISQRNPQCKDLGSKIADVTRDIAISRLTKTGTTPEQVLSPVFGASGGGCGGGCDDATGGICGFDCFQMLPRDNPIYQALNVDRMGTVLTKSEFTKINLFDGAAALRNAARAYKDVFGDTISVPRKR